jgi:DNA replication and repair protein RecF
MLACINERAATIHGELCGAERPLRVDYRSSVLEGSECSGSLGAREVAERYRQRLKDVAAREIEQAVSLVGPHRDDFVLVVDDVDLNTYGSRGQQRLAVLALKLAEAEWMRAETEELPVLLLDDILSELDARVRQYVLRRIAPHDAEDERAGRRQVLVTTTELEAFPAEFLARSAQYNVDGGAVLRA